MIKRGNKWAEPVERPGNLQSRSSERVVDEKSEEAHEWARYARDMPNEERISPSLISRASKARSY